MVGLLHAPPGTRLYQRLRKENRIKHEFYGNRIVMFAPLYLSNYCVNSCVYCPYHARNKHIIRKKLSTRGISQKVLDTSKAPVESNLKTTKEVLFIAGLDQDKAKTLTKLIREEYPKVKTQIQGEDVRVMSGSKDDLQAVMQLLRGKEDLTFPVNFTNFR